MSRVGKVVVVSGTVVSTAAGAVSGKVDSTPTNELVTSSEMLEALGVLLTAQALNTTKHINNSGLSGREKETLLTTINKYYAKYCYF